MKDNVINGLPYLLQLNNFTVFPEYFISISILYVLLTIVLITRNIYGLLFQKAISECIAFILLMSCYLIVNDDLLVLDFLSFNNTIINDYFAFFTKLTICFFSAIYFFIIADSLKEQRLTSVEYLVVILFAVLGLMLMCSSNDLFISYLTIELSSLAFYVMASFRKTSSYSVESGVKYLVTGAVSSAFFLLGSSFIYGLSGSINFSDFVDLFDGFKFDSKQLLLPDTDNTRELWRIAVMFIVFGIQVVTREPFDISFLEIGLALILFGLFIKLALAPFHLWSLDVYEGSPTSSTIFFAVISKLSLFVLLVRLCYVSFFTIHECWQFYSLWIGILSVFVGSFGGLKQRKLKTLFAYSSISHMGYAILSFSTCTSFGLQVLLYYMVIYMLSGLALWSIMLFLRVNKNNVSAKYSKELGDLVLLSKSNPALAFALAIIMFSIAGIPPLVGFIAKLGIFSVVVGCSFYLVALISILCSVVSTFYYIRIVKILYFESLLVGKLYHPLTTSKTLILSLLIFFFVFSFINPNLLYLLTYKVILSSFNL